MRVRDIRKMSPEERAKTLRSLKMKLVTLRTRLKRGGITNTAEIRNVKRDIARLLTVMRELGEI
ncbi:MAG: 50S ribosomal protein L29 [Candidatus Njordarchaeota archaeon]